MASKYHVWRRRGAVGLLVGVVTIAAGCGGSGSKAGSSGAGATSTSLKSSDRPFTQSTTAPSTAGANSVSAGGLDVKSVPSFVVTEYTSLISATAGKTRQVLENKSFLDGSLSPDAKHYATAKRADAVRAAGLDIISTATGKSERSFEIDATTVTAFSWSPDSSAVLVRETKPAAQSWSVYRLDGTTQTVATTYQPGGSLDTKWAIGPDGATWSECASFQGQCYPGFQLTTTRHVPVYLAYAQDTKVFGRFDVAKRVLSPLEGAGATATGATACGRYALLYRLVVGSGQKPFAVYDSDTGKVNLVPDTSTGCPVVSSTGSKMAFSTAVAPISVDVTTGKATDIAREGKPIAWSKDERQVLVQAPTGTFRVAADGSGGSETSVRLAKTCVVGTTGKVIASAIAGGVVLYDVGADSATKVSTNGLDETCLVTDDGKWAYTIGELYDIKASRAAPLEVRVNDQKQMTGKFAWRTGATAATVTSN